MPLKFAGVTLPLATPELEERLSRVHPQDFDDWSAWNFTGWDLTALPTPSLPVNPPFSLGRLNWPQGACRPAWFHAVVNTAKLSEIRAAVGDPMQLQNLLMDDGRSGKSITAKMFMLPARPLNQLGHDLSDSWILTLTDTRFYWMWKRGSISSKPASWSALFASLGTFLGVTIAVDTIDAAYASPSSKWIGYYRPTAAVLDAACTQIGHRLVVGLDGSVKTVKWETARAASDAYLLAADPVISGGLIDEADVARYVPQAVNCLFASADPTDTLIAPAPYLIGTPLASVGLGELYGTASGLPNASGYVFADLHFTGDNASACAAYASAASQDWYGWRAPDIDVVFPGIEPWVPTGWEDFVEWTYQRREEGPFASTRMRRGPWDDFVSGSWGAPSPSEPVPDHPMPPGTKCQACGWLSDKEALIIGNGILPKFMQVQFFDGATGGRCACFQAQGIDPTKHPYPWQAIYDSTAAKWKLMPIVQTCCSCGTMEIDIIGPNTVDEIDATMKAVLHIAAPCGGGAAYDYDLLFNCCTDGCVIFTGAGSSNCNSSPPYGCDNSFIVQICCADCDLETVQCTECTETCAPAWFFIPDPGFTNTYAVYNGLGSGGWFLYADGTCSWSVTCGVTITATITRVGNDSVITVTFTGGPSTVVYKYTEVGQNVGCMAPHTLSVQPPDDTNPDVPGSITLDPEVCVNCDDCCNSVFGTPPNYTGNLIATISNATGGCDCITTPLPFISVTYTPNWKVTWGVLGCTNETQAVFNCVLGRFSFVIGGGTGYTLNVITSTCDPFLYVADITFSSDPTNPCPSGSFRITITKG